MSWSRTQLLAAAIAAAALAATLGYLALRWPTAEELRQARGDSPPAAEAGVPLAAAVAQLRRAAAEQEEELAQAESAMLSTLPPDFQAATLSEAAALASIQIAALRQLAARTRAAIPAQLPLAEGLAADPAQRHLQLFQLLLLREALTLCLEAGIDRIFSLRLQPAQPAADQAYAVVALELEGEASWSAISAALGDLLSSPRLSLQALSLGPPRQGRLPWRATLALLCQRQPEWQLAPAPSAAPGGSRLRRLGGQP
ncbi:MAG: hypothetical protein RMM29_03220 [Planctomycetota bacterium]|nr:hypothetical protein [Planctomycetota bacterium]